MRTHKDPESIEQGEPAVKDEVKEKKEVTIDAALEAVAADAKPAPDMTIMIDDPAYKDLPLAVEQWYDEHFPAFKHVWRDGLITEKQLKSGRVEVVKGTDGEVIRFGQGDGMILVRFPKERFDKSRKYECETSEQAIAGIVREGLLEAKFMQTASPKKPMPVSNKVGTTG